MEQCSLSTSSFSSVSSCKADAKLLAVLLIMETDIKSSFSQEEFFRNKLESFENKYLHGKCLQSSLPTV